MSASIQNYRGEQLTPGLPMFIQETFHFEHDLDKNTNGERKSKANPEQTRLDGGLLSLVPSFF
jgi:hypothetical protein